MFVEGTPAKGSAGSIEIKHEEAQHLNCQLLFLLDGIGAHCLVEVSRELLPEAKEDEGTQVKPFSSELSVTCGSPCNTVGEMPISPNVLTSSSRRFFAIAARSASGMS